MKITLRVTYNDGATVDAVATTPDIVDYEDRWNRSITSLDDVLRYTDCCWLAWASLTRTQQTSADWRDWLASVDTCALASVEAQPVPLDRPGRSTSDSADSPSSTT